jgi:hypothetical protein
VENGGLRFSVTKHGTESGRLPSLSDDQQASMDFWSWLRVTGLGLCVVGGVVSAFAVPEVPVGFGLLSLCGSGLLNEQRIFMEEQRFEHEKSLRERDERSRQLQHEREIEMLHELEDFWSVKPDV